MLELTIGQLLPWFVGCGVLASLWRTAVPGRAALVLGYGYLVGSLALTLWMRALSAFGIAFGWMSIALPLTAAAAIAIWLGRKRIAAMDTLSPPPERGLLVAIKDQLAGLHWIWWVLFALIAAHLLLAGLEILWRPLFPWDAWTQWATKARVWCEVKRIAPFTDFATWLGGHVYIDAAPDYPANLPLLQAWSCITLGRWDDSLINVPFLSFALALAFGFYGQFRYAGHGSLFAMSGTYAVLSLPFVDSHLALAGYADLPLAIYYGLAAIAVWQWSNSRDPVQLILAVALAVACPSTKNPGWAWILTLLPACIVTLLPRHGLRIVFGLGMVLILAVIFLTHADVTIFRYRLGATFHPVWEPLWQNYFQFANWHLLWYLLPVLMALNHRRLLRPPLVAGTVIVGTGLGFLFLVFSFSNAADWVADYSTVNRATLHLAPLVVFYIWRLAHALVHDHELRTERELASG